MEALLSLFSGGTGYLAGFGTILVAFLTVYMRGRVIGARLERSKADAGKLHAAEERLEMDREATAAERKAAGMSDDDARKEAIRWAERR